MPESPPLAILFQDDCLIAVDKPAGQLVHPSDSPSPEDIVTMKVLRDQIGQQIYAIHRLDRPTSGVLLFGTDRSAAAKLSTAFEKREVHKSYWAVVDGHPAEDQWVCSLPLRKQPEAPERSAETRFRVIERLPEGLTLLEAVPKTGRHHQIRRHLLADGLPIVGDYRYAGIERCEALGEQLKIGTRMLLQARSLRFRHPTTTAQINIEAPTDPLIEKCR